MTELRALSRIILNNGVTMARGRVYLVTHTDGPFSDWGTGFLGYWNGDIDSRGRLAIDAVKGYQPPRYLHPWDILSLEEL